MSRCRVFLPRTRRERKIFERAGSIDYCEHKLLEIKDRAVSHLEILPESEAKQALFDLDS